jgi:hypothetical protein
MITTIRREETGTGLDKMFGYTAVDVETQRDVNTTQSENIFLALDEFKQQYEKHDFPADITSNLTLTPEEILAFSLIYQMPEREITEGIEGAYISRLIQNSYNNGHNNFAIERYDGLVQDNVAERLIGSEDNPIRLTVDCDIGHLFGVSSEYLIAEINGNTKSLFGFKSKYLDVNVNGNCGRSFGQDSHNLNAKVTENVWSMGNNSYYLNFEVGGDLIFGISNSYDGNFKISGEVNYLSRSCRFNDVKIKDQKVFDLLKEKLSSNEHSYSKTNKLIGPNGEVFNF